MFSIDVWGNVANGATFIMGLGWGVAWILFMPQVEVLYAVMAAVWIMGLSAAAVVAYSAQWSAMLSFFLPVSIPGTIQLLLYGETTTTALGIGIILAVFVFLRSMLLINRYMLHAIESKLDLETEIQERKKVEQELLEQSLKDRLTGLSNRRHFDEVLDQELRRAERLNYPLTLILIDLDYFKAYNDTYGHLKGDACLREIASVLQEAVKRPGDIAARYGGEEFALVLPNTSVANAVLVAERLQKRVSELRIVHT
ncbi:MAG: GGDEF domain-containing protein, partial [Gimesia chilikensis]